MGAGALTAWGRTASTPSPRKRAAPYAQSPRSQGARLFAQPAYINVRAIHALCCVCMQLERHDGFMCRRLYVSSAGSFPAECTGRALLALRPGDACCAGQARLSSRGLASRSQSNLHDEADEAHPQLYSSLLPGRRSAGDGGGLRRGVTTPTRVPHTVPFVFHPSFDTSHTEARCSTLLCEHRPDSALACCTPQPPMLRTGLLPLQRHTSAPSSLEPPDSHTPQSYHSASAGFGEHGDYGPGDQPEGHALVVHLQRKTMVRVCNSHLDVQLC